MKTYLELLGRAKSTIDNGFSQVGRALSPQDAAQRALMLLASRAVAVSNALMLLSTHNHANEALPLLRSLLQFAVEMRWISQADSAGRARKFLEEHKDPQWESLWNTPRLLERMNALSFQTTLVEAAANRAVTIFTPILKGFLGAMCLGHGGCRHRRSRALRAAGMIMGHVIKALDINWPGKFEGAEQLWEKTEIRPVS